MLSIKSFLHWVTETKIKANNRKVKRKKGITPKGIAPIIVDNNKPAEAINKNSITLPYKEKVLDANINSFTLAT